MTRIQPHPWIEKADSPDSVFGSLPQLLYLHNFHIPSDTIYVTIQIFGMEGHRRLVITPGREAEVLNRIAVRVIYDRITDPRALALFEEIDSVRIDFVEHGGKYWQLDAF